MLDVWEKIKEPKVDMSFKREEDFLFFISTPNVRMWCDKQKFDYQIMGELIYFSIECSQHANLNGKSSKIDEPKLVSLMERVRQISM